MLPKNHPIQNLIDKLYKQTIESSLPKQQYKALLNTITDLEQELPFYIESEKIVVNYAIQN